jgi:hypothetical protein
VDCAPQSSVEITLPKGAAAVGNTFINLHYIQADDDVLTFAGHEAGHDQLIVSRCAAHGYGIQRAKQALYEKKIPKEYWEDALSDYPDQTQAIMSFLRSRLADRSDQREIKRATDALLRRGHSYGDVRRALSRLNLDAEDFPEE